MMSATCGQQNQEAKGNLVIEKQKHGRKQQLKI
jgi:hypothetical protein